MSQADFLVLLLLRCGSQAVVRGMEGALAQAVAAWAEVGGVTQPGSLLRPGKSPHTYGDRLCSPAALVLLFHRLYGFLHEAMMKTAAKSLPGSLSSWKNPCG